jgi:uncharacterized membrane protein YfhO
VAGIIEEGRATYTQEDTFDVSRCTGSIVLPKFFFPGWMAQSNGQQLGVFADDRSGLVTIGLPSQTERITLSRFPTQIETIGLLTSLLSIATLAVFALREARPKNANRA